VAGIRDVLVALDLETGREEWRCDFPARFEAKLPAFGFVSSPLVDGEFVYVQAGEGVAKVDRRTGEVAWRMQRDGGGLFGSAFSSPVIAEIAGRRQLVVQTRQVLAGLDLGDGRSLWEQEVPAFRGMNILTPAVFGDRILTSSYGGGTFCFEVRPKDDGFDVRQLWKKTVQGYMSSPILHEGHAYLHLRNQRTTCLDLATGEEKWTTTPFGKYWSLAANGDRLLALDEKGELVLFRATPERFDLLDRRSVSEGSTWAHLAVAGRSVVVRALDEVQVYEWK
jgi:outer membrane protein assembly factor BamB